MLTNTLAYYSKVEITEIKNQLMWSTLRCVLCEGATILSITTLSIMTFSIMTFSIMTFNIMPFSIMTFSIMTVLLC
jgi:hypothetical protein